MNNKTPEFVIFHQPKTAGTYATRCLPKNYVLPHKLNYNLFLKQFPLTKTNPVCIVREPLDYYISLITFWCLDPQYCEPCRTKTIHALKTEYSFFKIQDIGHPNYWISRGFTERNLNKIMENMLSDEFIMEHQKKLSKKHHTYDNYVFSIMQRLDIGYYTFAFLDQFSRKKVSEIETQEECKNEIFYIRDNFIVLNQKNISSELKNLCAKYQVTFNDTKMRIMSSNRKPTEHYNISEALIGKMKYKERFIIECFNLD